MHETAIEEVVGRCVGIGFVEAPAWFALFAFWVRAHDGYWENGGQLLKVTDEVYTVSERAEEAFSRLVGGVEAF